MADSIILETAIENNAIVWTQDADFKGLEKVRYLEAISRKPERANILWCDVESLFTALGAEISEGNGSRVRVALKGVRAVFHRPHPRKETNKGAVKSVRRFLEAAGVKP